MASRERAGLAQPHRHTEQQAKREVQLPRSLQRLVQRPTLCAADEAHQPHAKRRAQQWQPPPGSCDYELLFSAPPARRAAIDASGAPVTWLGQVVAGDELLLRDAAGRVVELRGFEHR